MRGQLRRIWVIVTLFAAYFGVQLFSNSAWATEQRILFGINEVAMPTDMKNLKMLSSWVRMLDRHTREENRREHQQRDKNIRRHRPDDVSRNEKLSKAKVFH